MFALRLRVWYNERKAVIIPRLSRGERSEPSAVRKYASGGAYHGRVSGHGIMSESEPPCLQERGAANGIMIAAKQRQVLEGRRIFCL